MPRFGALVVDIESRRVSLEGAEVPLTRAEYALLVALAARPGAVVGNRALLSAMWGSKWHADTTPLQVHVSRLRRKLGESARNPRFIKTVRGVGYRFSAGADLDELGHAGASLTALVSLDRTIQWIESGVEEMLGWNPQDLVGLHVGALVHQDDLLTVPEWQELLAGQARIGTSRLRGTDGSLIPTRDVVRPILDAQGSVVGLLAEWHPHDMSSRAPDLGAIRLEGNHVLAPQARTVCLTYDGGLILRSISPHEPLLGWEPADIIGRPFVAAGSDPAQARSLVQGMLGSGVQEMHGVFTLRAKDGAMVPLNGTVWLSAGPGGSVRRVITVLEVPGSSFDADADAGDTEWEPSLGAAAPLRQQVGERAG